MKHLNFKIDDNTIIQILGKQNFTNSESAVFELVKNAYDAGEENVILDFSNNELSIKDDGFGMNSEDIQTHWMSVGKSSKGYSSCDINKKRRILAGSKGIGRFAIARLGNKVSITSKKASYPSIKWETDWQDITLRENIDNANSSGTEILIKELNEKWSEDKISRLQSFLERTCDCSEMSISIKNDKESKTVSNFLENIKVGINYQTEIHFKYVAQNCSLITDIFCDEFQIQNPNLQSLNTQRYCSTLNLKEQFINFRQSVTISELEECLNRLGDFHGVLYFVNKPKKTEQFSYKHSNLPHPLQSGVVLYRNAFSIASFDGQKDWLELGKRARKSPAAATHPTGSWRVRENQLTGKIYIDKRLNANLKDLSNRQGLEEDVIYHLFIKIIHTVLEEFERFRQNIIRKINQENKESINTKISTPLLDQIVIKPTLLKALDSSEQLSLSFEIKNLKQKVCDADLQTKEITERFRYDSRLLNVLATIGLRAASISHELHNNQKGLIRNVDNIVAALKKYDVWNVVSSSENTRHAYENVPYLLQKNKEINQKVSHFMDVLLTQTEKRMFVDKTACIECFLNSILQKWQDSYSWVQFKTITKSTTTTQVSKDLIQVIFDNLILNSIQHNDEQASLLISITIEEINHFLYFTYQDNGKGLAPKYLSNPRKILEVHETSRPNGHGLGMWIVQNSCLSSGGDILDIASDSGFCIKFSLGDS